MPTPYLGNRARCTAVLKKYGFSFRKKYGQNFLIDESVLEGIIDTAILQLTPAECALWRSTAHCSRFWRIL